MLICVWFDHSWMLTKSSSTQSSAIRGYLFACVSSETELQEVKVAALHAWQQHDSCEFEVRGWRAGKDLRS